MIQDPEPNEHNESDPIVRLQMTQTENKAVEPGSKILHWSDNDFFCEVDKNYIKTSFNLTGLNKLQPWH